MTSSIGRVLFMRMESSLRKLLSIVIFSCVVMATSAAAGQTSPSAESDSAKIVQLEQQVKSAQSSADNAWMLVSAALVLMMTGPGLALFYGGLVRKKNVLATMLQSFAMM